MNKTKPDPLSFSSSSSSSRQPPSLWGTQITPTSPPSPSSCWFLLNESLLPKCDSRRQLLCRGSIAASQYQCVSTSLPPPLLAPLPRTLFCRGSYWDTRVLVRSVQAEAIEATWLLGLWCLSVSGILKKWFEVRGCLAPEFPRGIWEELHWRSGQGGVGRAT
ncbi:hypothetical protein PIB30_097914 [Stylosanthes scabra]|uniref:Uncharacterized protein n=1 Tax=Stylosanthes scabra TaxID=79078 RepID=A0ABU6YY94_9FABA|nr:hypothetical protein [Stylosanthes scabra]